MIHQLSHHLLQGFAWGLSARQAGEEIKDLTQLSKLSQNVLSEDIFAEFDRFFQSETEFPKCFEDLDELIERYNGLIEIEEFLFDLLVLKLIRDDDSEDEDFLVLEQWDEKEDALLDRGSELLNFLVYLKDCKETRQTPTLEDFLNDFLLIADDEFQDEFFIYEDFIKNQGLLDGDVKAIVKAGEKLEDTDMQAIFIPIMMFFRNQEMRSAKNMLDLINLSPMPDIHVAIYHLCNKFYLLQEEDTGN